MKQFHLLCALFLVSCFGSQDISTRNLSSVYRSSDQIFHPEFSLFQFADDSARLYVKLNTSELLYIKTEDVFSGSLKIVCRLLESYESPLAYDTAENIFTVPKPSANTSKIFTLVLHIPKSQGYLAEITLLDVNKNTSEMFFYGLDATSPQSRNSFLVSKTGNEIPFFRNYLFEGEMANVTHRDRSIKNLYVKYYKRDFPLAAPPFSFNVNESFDYRYDSIFTYSPGERIALLSEGFYQFLIDSTRTEGLSLFLFNRGFPSVTTPAMMVESVRYLTSKREFEELKSQPNWKEAIEKFWLDAGGNQERTRMLIKKYYGRVQDANRLFSSFTEGWRTDRGMIYIIFGAPHIVYRSSVNESWVYGQAGNPVSLSFSFNKINNPFTDNDFMLSRAPVYEANWHQAIDVWRQGRVYNDYN